MSLILFFFMMSIQDSDIIISSKILNEDRLIQIHLPDNYERDESMRFPVVYVLDAEYAYDYAKGRVDFVSNGYGHLPKMIVVGIPNTDRAKDFYFRLNPEMTEFPFLTFLEKEVKTEVDRKFRTNGFDILYGWSSGSNINMVSLALKPKLFDAHILSGSGIGKSGKTFLEQHLPNRKYDKTFLFVSTESPGPRVAYLERFQTTIESIKPSGMNSQFRKIEDDHVGNLASGFDAGIQFIFDGFYIPESVIEKGSKDILNYYTLLNRNYSVNFDIPEGAIVEICSMLFGLKKYDDIFALLDHGLTLHPKSVELLATYGEVFSYLKRNDEAKSKYKEALALSRSKKDQLKFKALLKNLP